MNPRHPLRPGKCPLARPRYSRPLILTICCLGFSITSSPAATLEWGSASNGDWGTAGNWNPVSIPGAGDDVLIGATGSPYIVTLNLNPTINSFTQNSADASLVSVGRTVNLSGASQILAGKANLHSTTWNGTGDFSNAGELKLQFNTTINSGLVNSGVLFAWGDFSASTDVVINGSASNSGTLNLESWNSSTAFDNPLLTFNQGLSNSGTLNMRTAGSGSGANSATLSGGASGTITNTATGIIDIQAGGGRTISAHLDNQGTINIATTTSINRNNGNYTNNGDINLNAGDLGAANINSWGGSGNVTGNGGNVTFAGNGSTNGSSWNNASNLHLNSGDLTLRGFQTLDNSGSIAVDSGVLLLQNYGTFNNSGAISVAPGSSATLSAGTFNMASGGTFAGGGGINVRSNANLVLAGAYSNGASPLLIADSNTQVSGPGTLTNASTLLLANGAAINSGLVNNGVMDIQGDSSSPWILDVGGPASNNGTINLNSRNDNTSLDNPILNFHQGLSNNGTLVMRTLGSGSGANSATLSGGASGTITNTATGIIDIQAGGGRTISAHLDNQGTINIATTTSINRNNGNYTNNGDINLNAGDLGAANINSWGGSGNVTGNGGNVTFAGNGSTNGSSWNNASNLHLNSGDLTLRGFQTLDNSGSIAVDSGVLLLQNYGTFNNSGAISVAPGSSATLSAGTFNMASGGTFAGGGGINVRSNANLVLAGAYSNGASPLLIADSNTQVSGPGTLTNASTLLLANGAAINSGLVNNGVMDIQGDSSSPWILDVGGPASNNGTINLNSRNDNTSLDNPILNFHQGLSNNGTLVMRTLGSGSGANSTTLNIGSGGVLVNQGLGHIILEGGGTRIINGTVANQGNLSAATNITLGTAGSAHTNSGILTLLGNSTATIIGASFINQAGGVLAGNGTFKASTTGIINEGSVAPGQSPGLLAITGDYTQATGGSLNIEIGGLVAGTEFDRLTVSGTASLAGILNVSLLGGFDPAIGSNFDFLLAGNVLGSFDQVLLPSLSGKTFDISYASNLASLTVIAAPVPLPPSLYLLGIALLALIRIRRV